MGRVRRRRESESFGEVKRHHRRYKLSHHALLLCHFLHHLMIKGSGERERARALHREASHHSQSFPRSQSWPSTFPTLPPPPPPPPSVSPVGRCSRVSRANGGTFQKDSPGVLELHRPPEGTSHYWSIPGPLCFYAAYLGRLPGLAHRETFSKEFMNLDFPECLSAMRPGTDGDERAEFVLFVGLLYRAFVEVTACQVARDGEYNYNHDKNCKSVPFAKHRYVSLFCIKCKRIQYLFPYT